MEMKIEISKTMKSLVIICFTFLIIISCKSIEINPTDIIGKWRPSLYIPYNFKDDTWGKAYPIDSLSKNYIIEFTNDNKFLINGKSGGVCCYAGDKYSISENGITFSELSLNGCQNVFCYNCAKWTIEKLDSETLILEECNKRKIQYIKTN
jgi:hypothetical protein